MDDNDYLVNLLMKIVEENERVKDSFWLEFLKVQLECVRKVFLYIFKFKKRNKSPIIIRDLFPF